MTDNDSYYEICIALDSAICAEVKDVVASEVADFTNEGLEFAESGAIIIRTSQNAEFIDALLAHLQGVCKDLSAINNQNIAFSHTIEVKQNRDWIAEYKSGIKPLQCGRFYIYPPWNVANSSCGDFLGSASARFVNEPTSSISSLASHNPKNSSTILEFASCKGIAESALDSAKSQNLIKKPCHSEHSEESKNNPSLRADSQNLRGNPPYDTALFSSGRLPRSHSLARNDNIFLDSSLRKCSAQNDNFSVDSATRAQIAESSEKSPQDEFATINILLEPSLAFGTGHHASTFMCIEAIQALHAHDSLKNKKVLDFGCGSGILALCAEKLGAVVDLCDIDESAIIESKKNFNNNNATISHIWQGGIADRVAKKGAKSGIYDIILANIIASVLIEQKDNITSSLKRGGIAVLSGILDIYKDEVLARFSDFVPLAICQSDEWICAVLQKA